MGHRQWLPKEHPFRYDAGGFDENVEHGCAPEPLTTSVVLAELEGTTFTYSKGETQYMDTNEKDDQHIWKQKEHIFRFVILGVQHSLP